ncbi:prestin-like isoform X2 [Gigantopelta aegis]|uniref:prestin-like isoform X2 n=1 Tax=Gigantopelta aegis TaxID=1735272 RepID=UPI001B88C1F6|nr:prestin-like isoform X2 [Gigantopelta aegis]
MNGHTSDHGEKEKCLGSVEIRRPLYKTQTFRDRFMKTEDERQSLTGSLVDKLKSSLQCKPEKRKNCLYNVFPFFGILRKYKWREDLPNDVIAGLTVGIMQLPQGMAYSMLADMPPVVGLYMAFFPVLIYFLFGTSKQISMGTVAVVSLMTGGVVSKATAQWRLSQNLDVSDLAPAINGTMLNGTVFPTGTTFLPGEIQFKFVVASTVCFMAGVIQIIMGFGKIGFVTTYMSDSLVSGFTTGAAVHVFTSQVKYILGLKIPRFENMFQIANTYKALILNIGDANIASLVISGICIVILYVVKVQINQRFKSKLKIPIPVELVVVIAGTIASHFGQFYQNYHIKVVGAIPAGLPVPSVPNFSLMPTYISDSFGIAVVAFAQSVSLAVLMAKKHHYDIDSNKELMAYGLGNVFGSFFSCYPFAASVSRSSVQDSAGGRTQVASLFSATLVLIVILFIGPLFEALPNCVLSAIIVVALRSMFLQVLELRELYKISIYDCAIWVVTFVCVVFLHVDVGLVIGIIFSFFTVVVRTQITKATSLEKVHDVEVLKTSSIYEKTEHFSGVKVVGFNAPLYYANAELFMKNVFRVVGIKPRVLRKKLKKLTFGDSMTSQQVLITDVSVVMQMEPTKSCLDKTDDTKPMKNGKQMNGSYLSAVEELRPVHHVVIDCSAMHFIDPVGVKMLKQIYHEYNTVGITVFLGGVRDEVWPVLEYSGFVDLYGDCIFLTVYDAVMMAMEDQKCSNGFIEDAEQTTIIVEASPEDKLLPMAT